MVFIDSIGHVEGWPVRRDRRVLVDYLSYSFCRSKNDHSLTPYDKRINVTVLPGPLSEPKQEKKGFINKRIIGDPFEF